MTDDKLKRYFDALWERYQWAKEEAKPVKVVVINDSTFHSGYIHGYRAGLDFAIETLKTVFEIAEKAERSEE